MRDLKHFNMNYILGVKPGSHEKLFEAIERRDAEGSLNYLTVEEEIGDKVKKKRIHQFRYTNGILLNHSDVATSVNQKIWKKRIFRNRVLIFLTSELLRLEDQSL